LWLVRLLIIPELKILTLFPAVDKPFLLRLRHEVQLELVDLVNQLVGNLLLEMSDEELREVINLLMEQFDNVLRDVVSEEAYLEALPEILHEQVKVERVLSRIILFNC